MLDNQEDWIDTSSPINLFKFSCGKHESTKNKIILLKERLEGWILSFFEIGILRPKI